MDSQLVVDDCFAHVHIELSAFTHEGDAPPTRVCIDFRTID